jgi:hypothetical protein
MQMSECGTLAGYTRHYRRGESIDAACRKAQLDYQRSLREDNPEWIKDSRKRTRLKLRTEVLQAYGGKCFCCGETDLRFLTLDHIASDGAEHRRSFGGTGRGNTDAMYRWFRENHRPDMVQVACLNCNAGRYWNGGVCPHEES